MHHQNQVIAVPHPVLHQQRHIVDDDRVRRGCRELLRRADGDQRVQDPVEP
jgi:hypothetical protein